MESTYKAFDFQPNSKKSAIIIQRDGDLSILGIKLGMEYQAAIQQLSRDYKFDYASSPDGNVIQVDNICLNPRAASCMVCFDFNPTTNILETISLVSKYATNFCWCFREISRKAFVKFHETHSANAQTYLFYTEKCKIKVSCYSFESSSGKRIEKQMAKIEKQDSNHISLSEVRSKSIKMPLWLIADIIGMLFILLVLFIAKPQAVKVQSKSGEYVYIDEFGIVHADRKCKRLNYKGMMSERIKVSDLTAEYNDFCTQCVDDEAYENLTK